MCAANLRENPHPHPLRRTPARRDPGPAAATVDAPKAGVGPELIAAVSAAIAEEMGTDISAIRIISMKQI